MQAVDWNARRYDRRTIFFHWLTLFLVVLQFAIAWTIDDFPRGPLRVDSRSCHILVGTLLAAVLGARLAWRMTRGRRLPPADRHLLHVVAKVTHWGLYLVLLTIGWVIIGLVGLHASAAIAHRALWRDGVLARMAPAGAAGQD